MILDLTTGDPFKMAFVSLWCVLIVLCTLPYFLVQDSPGSSYTFIYPVLKPAIVLRRLGSLSWKIVFGSQIWALGIDNAIVVLLLPDSLEASFTYFYSHAYKHTQYSQILYLYLYLSGHEFTLLYSKQHHKIHSSFLPSYICNNLW